MWETPSIAVEAGSGQSECMTRREMTQRQLSYSRLVLVFFGLLIPSAATRCAFGEPTAAAVSAFNSYTGAIESRLAQQHQSQDGFLASMRSASQIDRLRRGELIVERLTPVDKVAVPEAMLHHWRGTVFAPGAKAADFERLMKNFGAYPQYFSPQVMQAKMLSQDGDRMQVMMRVRQKHVLTVVMDTTYDINFGRLDAQHGHSISRSTKVSEIASAGTSDERVLSGKDEHGFLWRLNTYWSYEERKRRRTLHADRVCAYR